MAKLIEGNKDNLIIDVNVEDGKVEYSYKYNSKVSFDWREYAKKKLFNTYTKEFIEYGELIVVRSKDSKQIYLYPSRILDIDNQYDMYNIENWLFEDSSAYNGYVDNDKIASLENKIDNIAEVIKALVNVERAKLGDKGFQENLLKAYQDLTDMLTTLTENKVATANIELPMGTVVTPMGLVSTPNNSITQIIHQGGTSSNTANQKVGIFRKMF